METESQSKSSEVAKPSLARKPSFKNKKLPEIRQTLSSKYRLLKANPLLMYDLVKEETSLPLLKGYSLKSIAMSMDAHPNSISNNKPEAQSLPGSNRTTRPDKVTCSSNEPKMDTFSKPVNSSKHVTNSKIHTSGQFPHSSTPISNTGGPQNDFIRRNIKAAGGGAKAATKNKFKKPEARTTKLTGAISKQPQANASSGVVRPSCNPNIEKKDVNIKPPRDSIRPQHTTDTRSKHSSAPGNVPAATQKSMRRSLSAVHIDRKKGARDLEPEKCYSRKTNDLEKSKSFDELKVKTVFVPDVSPVIEESNARSSMTFKTPSAYERRSVISRTPNTTNNRRSFSMSRMSTPTYDDLQKRLNDWLKRRGKSLSEFYHLKCFDIHAGVGNRVRKEKVDDENKENVETDILNDLSYEELRIPEIKANGENISFVEEATGNNYNGGEDLEVVAKEALLDLHKLVLEGYPEEQCDAWLRLMREKFNHLEEESQYWECRAAIEQARGDITSAVECYRTAIVQGAEVKAVDESLDQLLKKFSLLDISTKNEGNAKERARIMRDARNVFKSSIIQFAVQEKTLKKKNKGEEVKKMFVATPVRRSTRLSRSHYVSTPGVKIYSSLLDVESPIRNSIDFHHNSAFK